MTPSPLASWLSPLLLCLFLSRPKKIKYFYSFFHQRKWETPTLWHKTCLFMALNYLVIHDDHNTYKHEWDDIYVLLLWFKSYIYSNLVEICWILNNNVDFGFFEWHFYHGRLATWFSTYYLIFPRFVFFPLANGVKYLKKTVLMAKCVY